MSSIINLLVFGKWLFYGGYSSLDNFRLIIFPIIMMEQKGKGYQRIRSIEAFQYENKRSDFKCCDYWEKRKTICQTKVTPDIDGFTDEPVVYQCDALVVKNTFVDDSK